MEASAERRLARMALYLPPASRHCNQAAPTHLQMCISLGRAAAAVIASGLLLQQLPHVQAQHAHRLCGCGRSLGRRVWDAAAGRHAGSVRQRVQRAQQGEQILHSVSCRELRLPWLRARAARQGLQGGCCSCLGCCRHRCLCLGGCGRLCQQIRGRWRRTLRLLLQCLQHSGRLQHSPGRAPCGDQLLEACTQGLAAGFAALLLLQGSSRCRHRVRLPCLRPVAGRCDAAARHQQRMLALQLLCQLAKAAVGLHCCCCITAVKHR